MDLITRARATELTIEHFRNETFRWGRADCCYLIAHCYREMTGINLLKGVPRYTTLLGAIRAMRKVGALDFAAYLDRHFARIAPAAVLAGDIVAIPSDEPRMPLALALSVGQGRILAWAPDGRAAVGPISAGEAAWRVA